MLASPWQVQISPPALVEGDEQVCAEVSMSHKDLCLPQLFLQETINLVLCPPKEPPTLLQMILIDLCATTLSCPSQHQGCHKVHAISGIYVGDAA